MSCTVFYNFGYFVVCHFCCLSHCSIILVKLEWNLNYPFKRHCKARVYNIFCNTSDCLNLKYFYKPMVLLSNKQFVNLNSEFAFPSLCFFPQNIAHSTDPWTVVKLQLLFRYRRYQNFRRNLKIPTWPIGYND